MKIIPKPDRQFKRNMNDQGGVTISTEQQIFYAKKEYSYVISKRDWTRVTTTIDKLQGPSAVWSNVAWGTLGIAVSCLASWATCNDTIYLLGIGCLASGIAVCSFFANYFTKKTYIASLSLLKEVVEEIENVIIEKKS